MCNGDRLHSGSRDATCPSYGHVLGFFLEKQERFSMPSDSSRYHQQLPSYDPMYVPETAQSRAITDL